MKTKIEVEMTHQDFVNILNGANYKQVEPEEFIMDAVKRELGIIRETLQREQQKDQQEAQQQGEEEKKDEGGY